MLNSVTSSWVTPVTHLVDISCTASCVLDLLLQVGALRPAIRKTANANRPWTQQPYRPAIARPAPPQRT